jgi:F0F1-type ATP synthase beta subunit
MIHNMIGHQEGVSIFCGIGERCREGEELYRAKAKTPSDLTPQIAKRAYELYEERGRKGARAVQDWEKAEREIRKAEAKAEPKPKTKSQ